MNKKINIYSKRQRWKFALFGVVVLIGIASTIYTNRLVTELAQEERKKVELWAEGTRLLISGDSPQNISFIFKVIRNNNTVPVILTNSEGEIIDYRNLDSSRVNRKDYLKRQLAEMKEENEPIEIDLGGGKKHYIFYKDSTLLTQLYYYPFIQIGVILFFIIIAFWALNSSMKAEQNQVWVGMAKETAHQLGTPISSLMAWAEILRDRIPDQELVKSWENDVQRLEKIAERFSKIGSAPVLQHDNIIRVITNAINYFKSRFSAQVQFKYNFDPGEEIMVPVNVTLFEWVIENICKNSIDAMKGKGTIEISLTDSIQVVYIDIKDTGKGLSRRDYKSIFQPGYTTKPRGWGLGLSLTKRIIEQYHRGKIFVNSSEVNSGTTLRIVLKK